MSFLKRWFSICPSCGKRSNWDYGDECPLCGYKLKVIACPRCASMMRKDIDDYNDFISDRISNAKSHRECYCSVPYIEVDMTKKEAWNLVMKIELPHELKEGLPSNVILDIEWAQVHRHIYETLFDKSQIDVNCEKFKQNLYYMYPETEEAKQYFDELREYEKQSLIEGTQRYLASLETNKHTPTCPICKSTNLSKISAGQKVGRAALIGVYAAGDFSKTWKCNNCGSKF